MLEDLSSLFAALSSAEKTAKVLKELLKGTKGDRRALLEELKENLTLCWLVVEQGTAPDKVIPAFKTSEYDRLNKTDFNFNSLQKKKIRRSAQLEASELASLIGKKTADLIINIYDKIKTLKQAHDVDSTNTRIRWHLRILNLHRRMLLLIKHLQSR